MKILNGSQLKQVDAHTIKTEPITSLQLMEHAGIACSNWIQNSFGLEHTIAIVCGTGNNGGDGLVIARHLIKSGYNVDVFVIDNDGKQSPDFTSNADQLNNIQTLTLQNINVNFDVYTLIIDSIIGSGLNRPIEGLIANVITKINAAIGTIISIDLPSGLLCENNSTNTGPIVKADFCLTLQLPKLALLLPENQQYVSEFVITPIGLDQSFIESQLTDYLFIDEQFASSLYLPRTKYAHKGHFGHALLAVGSFGKIGAAVLATKGCLRSGVGLITVFVPKIGYQILQARIPEAMVQTSSETNILSDTVNTEGFTVGVGPGIGMHATTARFLQNLLRDTSNPMVIDADAINILAENKAWIRSIPDNSILTPHPKELERLIGPWKNDFDKLDRVKLFCKNNDLYVVIKGAHTAIVDPTNTVYFNSTGNPGMATAGSGDVLTGVITGLLTQGYSSLNAAILGVYLHGLAGDLAVKDKGQDAMIASDIINNLGTAFQQIQANGTK